MSPSEKWFFTQLGIGFLISMAYVIIMLLGKLWPSIWKWLDDGDSKQFNPCTSLVGRLYGYKRPIEGVYQSYDFVKDPKDRYSKGSQLNDDEFIWPGLFLFFSPFLWALVANFPFIPVTLALLVAIAFLARGGRRLSKKLQLHVTNKNIHNNSEEEK